MSRRKHPRKFRATFENGGFWDYYKDLERQFENFLDHVPYIDRNERVCSFRLVNLLLSIGGHVDSAFKEMAGYQGFSKNKKCKEIRRKVKESRKRIRLSEKPITVSIGESLSAFEELYELSKNEVIFKRLPEREMIVPFDPHNPKTNAPRWWDIYNGIKHDFSNAFENANLLVTRNALAGAFLLNVIHKPGILRLNDHGILKWPPQPIEGEFAGDFDHALVRIPQDILEDMLKRNQILWGFVETPLFIYDYYQAAED